MLVVVVVHMVTAIGQARAKAMAAAERGPDNPDPSAAADTAKRLSGFFLLFFLAFHLLDLTKRAYVPFPMPHEGLLAYGGADLGYLRGEVFHNMVLTWTNPLSLIFYVAAMLSLGGHLFHGTSSMLQTLGSEASLATYRKVAAAVAAIVVLGNLSIVFHGVAAGVTGRATITGHGAQTADVPAALQVRGRGSD